ncbi:MAG: hypothetical protein HY007_02675 [Candidatus Sungbacteria bacterium]|nr:hypothetical protein [Candidatus Sungbacteria bacterium]
MNPNPLAIVIIIAIGALVFGGIVLFGLHGRAPAIAPSSPGITGTVSRIPDILNLPGFGNRPTNPGANRSPSTPASQGTPGPDVVVETHTLPPPILPLPPSQSLVPGARNQVLPTPRPQTPLSGQTPQSRPLSNASKPLPRATSSVPILVPKQPTPSQAAAIAAFSVFDVSPQLRDFRAQMVQEGVIKDTEFIKINNNRDMEQFLLKLVEWKGKQASSTPAQMQDSRDRITKAYDQIRSAKK